jgi:hypothetical protein
MSKEDSRSARNTPPGQSDELGNSGPEATEDVEQKAKKIEDRIKSLSQLINKILLAIRSGNLSANDLRVKNEIQSIRLEIVSLTNDSDDLELSVALSGDAIKDGRLAGLKRGIDLIESRLPRLEGRDVTSGRVPAVRSEPLPPPQLPDERSAPNQEESSAMNARFTEFQLRVTQELEILRKSPPEVTADSDGVEKAFEEFYQNLSAFRSEFQNLHLDLEPVRQLELKIFTAEFFCRGAAILIGQANEELKERSASSQANWDAHVVGLLLQRMDQIAGLIKSMGEADSSRELVLALQSIKDNYSNRKLLQYSWCQVMSALEGDGETVTPPTGLTDSIFPFSGKIVDYFVNSTEKIPEIFNGWHFNPIVGKASYQLPDFFDISGERRTQGSYNQTLFDFLMQTMDEIYAGKRKDAKNNRGQVINSRNLDVSKTEIYEYLEEEARKKIQQELANSQTIVDPGCKQFVDRQDKLAQNELEVMAVLAYRVSMLATGHRIWLSPGTVYGQSAKAIYDTDPNYWWTYRLTNEGGWHVLQFLNLWGIPGVDYYDLLYGKDGLKYRNKREVVMIKLRDSKKKLLDSKAPTAEERYKYYGTTTYEFLFYPMIELSNECRQVDPDTGLPVEKKLRLNPSLLRQQALKVDPDKLSDDEIAFKSDGVPLRFGITPQNADEPVGDKNTGMLVTFDHLVDPNTGKYLYALMPWEQLGTEWIQYYRGWANNVRSFMDKFLFSDAQTFSANLEDPKVLAGIKKINKYIAPYQPKIGAEAAAGSKMKLRNGWEAKYTDVLENTIIVKLVLTKLQLDYSIYHTKTAAQVSEYLSQAYEAGVLGPGEIGRETRDAIYSMVVSGGEIVEFSHKLMTALVTEMRNLNIYKR